MSRKRRQQRDVQPTPSGVTPQWFATRRLISYGVVFGLGASLAFAVITLTTRPVGTDTKHRLGSISEALGLPSDALNRVDIAELNLLCAQGLPGSESLDVEACLKTLDQWTERVRSETNRHFYKWRANPEEFDNSEGTFRIMMLITVLQQDFGVHYNKDRIADVDFSKPEDLFIHGMIHDDNGGTCVSMPVLYTAIARRLGYPVKLVAAKAHLFCRWDGPNERFNIEGTGAGFSNHSDEHYKKWPYPIDDWEVEQGLYLKSLSPKEELACMLAARGHCLDDNGRLAEACVAYAQACEQDSTGPAYYQFLSHTMRKRQGPNAQRIAAQRRAEGYNPYVYAPNPREVLKSRIPQAVRDRFSENSDQPQTSR